MNISRFTPFAYGFRPFFFAALVYAPLAILMWLWMRAAGGLPLPSLPPQLWHGHEMIFGFVGAAIAGFLLTAVPSWTGSQGFSGSPLVGLTMLWLAGRATFACATLVPLPMLAAIELLFLPVLAFFIGPPLLRARDRNTPLLIVLAALWSTDAVFMYALLHADPVLATKMLHMSINVVLLLITVIGGRIVPTFTANALRKRSIAAAIRRMPWLEVIVIGAMALTVVVDAVEPIRLLAPIVAAVAACAHAVRLAGWQGLRTLHEPLVWILHVAYAWLPVGLALKAIYLLDGAPWAAQWLHALAAGTIALMVIAVITRASLGHTGRALQISRVAAIAYSLLAAAALVRVFGAVAWTSQYESAIRLSGALWATGFALIVIIYAPILLRARADGKSG